MLGGWSFFLNLFFTVSCGDPGIPANSMRSGDSFLYDDEVVFTCNNGYYQSSGPVGGVRRCLDTGLWSDSQPVCTRGSECIDHMH